MFWRIVGHEVLARPSAYELTVLTDKESIDAADILGRSFDVVIEFADADGGTHKRHCQGHAMRFTRVAQSGRFTEYRISLRSWFWLLSKRVNARILQNKPVLGVVDAVLDDSPVGSLKKIKSGGVVGPHVPHVYCVQYRESDYQFLSRLLEEEGIYYWFDAHDAPGTLYLSDTSTLAHEKLPVADTLSHVERGASEGRFNEITRWISSRQFESGKFASRDRDFKVISKQLHADKGDPDTHELADLEVFEFPGGYASGDDTDNLRDLTDGILTIEDRGLRAGLIAASPRVGISVGTDRPWRFYVEGNPAVSGLKLPRSGNSQR
jgi:type VI secretion system secreted protein VgrG